MATPIKRLDHIAVVNRELAGLEEAYTCMGFQLTAVSRHSGSLTPGGPVEPMGSGNRCAMLREGYLELLAVVDPNYNYERIDVMLAKHAGMHNMAFGCDDSLAAQAHLNAAGFTVTAPSLLERMAQTSQGQQLVKFRNLRLSLDEMPEGTIIVIKHETPDLLWEPHLLAHPNGAVGLREITLCVADLDEVAPRYGRMLGVDSERQGERAVFNLSRGRYVIVSEAELPQAVPGASAPLLPFPAAFTCSVENLDATAALFAENGVPYEKHDGRLVVPAEFGRGATVMFEQV